MIVHLVLFRPRADLPPEARAGFVSTLQQAFANIPHITRAHVGRRVTIGRQYDDQNLQQFPYVAIVEFADEADLRAYLDHPAHRALGEQFYVVSDAAAVYDFELLDAGNAARLLA